MVSDKNNCLRRHIVSTKMEGEQRFGLFDSFMNEHLDLVGVQIKTAQIKMLES
jgi:hypothetical protein